MTNHKPKQLPLAPPAGVTSRVEEITPALAAEWLATANTDNRHMRESSVLKYAEDMAENRWPVNGEAIKFGASGRLIDGQHRLQACVLAEVPFKSLVVRGIVDERRAFDTMDSGVKRQTADAIRHMANATSVSAIAKMAFLHANHGIDKLNDSRYKPTRTQEVDFIRANEAALTEAAHVISITAVRCLSTPRVAGFCYFAFAAKDRDTAKRFFDDVFGGVNLESTNPAFHLRDRLIKENGSKAKLPTLHMIALFIKAWNAYVQGKPMRILKSWKTDGQSPEAFPQIEGRAS